MEWSIAVQLALMLGFPAVAIAWSHRTGWGKWLSPVVLCYAAGIAVANLGLLDVHPPLAHRTSELSVLLAIPLLLYSTDLKAVSQLARSVLVSFGLCVLSGVAVSVGVALAFGHTWPHAWQVSGMLVGVYTGGTPNMNAIGIALRAPEEVFVYLNAADVLTGGVYLLFLTSVGPRVFGLLLPPFPEERRAPAQPEPPARMLQHWRGMGKGVLLAVAIVGASAGLTWLMVGSLQQPAWVILFLSSFSVAASFVPAVRRWEGTYAAGDYLLLVFCVSVGMLARFGDVWAHGALVAGYTALVMVGTVLLHWVLAALARIDRDTFVITSTAALYGPPFIGQVAQVLDNRTLVVAGIAMGLAGYAIGNFLGIAVGNVVYVVLY